MLTILPGGGIGGGLTRNEIFPNLFQPNGQAQPRIRAQAQDRKRNREADCRSSAYNRYLSLVENNNRADGGIWTAAAANMQITPTNTRTIASLFYCWSNDGGATWEAGVITQISGGPGQAIPDIVDVFSDELPIDPSIRAMNGEIRNQVDAERKVLLAALHQTHTGTIGAAYLVHSGPSVQCSQCGLALGSFKGQRLGIAVGQSHSDWWTRFPDVYHG